MMSARLFRVLVSVAVTLCLCSEGLVRVTDYLDSRLLYFPQFPELGRFSKVINYKLYDRGSIPGTSRNYRVQFCYSLSYKADIGGCLATEVKNGALLAPPPHGFMMWCLGTATTVH
jgi:hypothetical protein